MAKKVTGLAAFARPKNTPAAEARTDSSEIAPATIKIPSPRRRRGEGETVALTVKVRRSDWRRLRQLADAEGTTIQAMAEAGFSAVLASHGLPPIESYSR